MRRPARIILGLAALALAGVAAGARPVAGAPGEITLPPGFTLRQFATGVQDARFLTYSPAGDLYVGQLLGSNSAITILPDRNHDGAPDRALRVAADLNSPNNVSFQPGAGAVFAAGAFDRVRVYSDPAHDLSYSAATTLVAGLSNAGRRRAAQDENRALRPRRRALPLQRLLRRQRAAGRGHRRHLALHSRRRRAQNRLGPAQRRGHGL